MTLNAKGIFPGNVPQSWLVNEDLFLCKYCLQLIANSRHSSHLHHCGQNSQPSHIPITGVNEDNLPSFEELCDLKCPTLRFVPRKSRAAFARALSSTLRSLINDNSEQAWLKLLCFQSVSSPLLSARVVTLIQLPLTFFVIFGLRMHLQHFGILQKVELTPSCGITRIISVVMVVLAHAPDHY